MKILVDENNIVTSVIRVGDAEGGIEVGEYPADLVPLKYKYIDSAFEVNPDYTEPDEPTSEDATADEILNVLLGV